MKSMLSFQPIVDSIACNDDVLVEAVMKLHAKEVAEYNDGVEPDMDDLEEFRDYVESMIKCPAPPVAEPGCWNYVIDVLAEHFGLHPDRLPMDDWKHFYVWEDYRSIVDSKVSPAAVQLLAHLEDGRPFKGETIGADGCVFAWLTANEVVTLHDALSVLDVDEMDVNDLDEFHEELLECLASTRERNAVLFMAAH